MIRTKRKINKQRGSRSNGGGCTKKRRGAGNKGGKGKAGILRVHAGLGRRKVHRDGGDNVGH